LKVRSGWNSEYARKKYDVEVDEADLARIITGAGMPLEAVSIVTLGDAHNLLWYSAEILARQALVSFDPTLKQRLTEEARGLVQKRKDLLLKIRSQWEAAQDSQADQIAAIQKAKAEVRQELGMEPYVPENPVPLEVKP
jgi:hypothetical protein